MMLFSQKFVLIISILTSVGTKLHSAADNTAETRSLVVESSVANDNICNNREKNVAYDVILFDNNSPMQRDESTRVNKRQAPQNDKNDFKDRPRPDQRSLLIVFDATGSMHRDLEQLRSGAQEIVNELSARADNPIFNYVLVVYRDPEVLPAFDTKNPEDLLTKLKGIDTLGGGDCPEYAVSGLKIALEFALMNSLAYVFSDATAKDLQFFEEALDLIQKKQVSVNFLLTGDCGNKSSPGYQVYHKLARASNGQVYDMEKSDVKDVLMAIRHTVNYKYTALKSVDSESAGTTNTKLNIDKSISELSVSMAGKNPKLTITDPRNETIRNSVQLSLENLQLIKIKNPLDGQWNVEAVADSSHSIRLGAISEMKFEFGFSIDEPSRITETSFQPLAGEKNMLSVFVSNPSLIESLSDITIILVPTSSHDNSMESKILLRKLSDEIYSTKAFDVPRQMFKIQLNGIDANGNVIERLLSTGLKSSYGSVPEIFVEVNQREINEFERLLMKCVVKSFTPVDISWQFEGKILKKISSNQSNELEFVINQVVPENSGQYVCEAKNGFGSQQNELTVKVLSAPKISISSKELVVNENSHGNLECSIDYRGFDKKCFISWIVDGKIATQENSPKFEFVASRHHHSKTIRCQAKCGDFLINSDSLVFVNFPPKFLDKDEAKTFNLKVTHGSNVDLQCQTDENPQGIVSWFFNSKNREDRRNIEHAEKTLSLKRMTGDLEGQYDCVVENSLGRVKRSFKVVDLPKAPPKILIDQDVMIVNETESIDLICETHDSFPIQNYSWHNENLNNYETFTIKNELKDVFQTILHIKNIDESDNGLFECFISNSAGSDRKSFELLVQTAPKIDQIIMRNAAVVEEIEGKISVLKNEVVNFDCIVDGYPNPEIVWFKDQDEQEIPGNETGIFVINVKDEDEGSYRCSAKNILGSAVKSFTLKVNSPPSSTESENKLIKVVENDKVKLSCDFKGKPEPKVSWLFNEKTISEDSRIFFGEDHKVIEFKAHLDDSGVFKCLGFNQFGTSSKNFTILVMGKNDKKPVASRIIGNFYEILGRPKILLPNDVYKKEKVGGSLNLSCDASGFPNPQIYWTKNDKNILNGSILALDKLKLQDSSPYICNAVNEVGSSQKVFYVTIVETPEIISSFNNVSLFTNEIKEVECHVKGTPHPEVFWMFDGNKIKSGSKLTFDSTMHSGDYSCVSENSEGRSEKSFHFTAINKPTLLHESVKTDFKLREGDDLELVCPFENFNKIFWRFNDNSIENFTHKISNNKLIIPKVDRFISRDWKCVVSNLAGTDSFSFKVTILVSPIIHASWNLNNRVSDFLFTESDIDEKTFKVGETLSLNCTAQGFPKPKVFWKKATDIVGEGEVYTLDNLQFHHSDIYTCGAENDQGTVKKFFKIDVVSAPIIETGFDIQRSYQKAIGDSVTLRCRIGGNPLPNIFWFKDNVLLDETEDHLEIDKLNVEHDGNYKCIGKNSWGRETIEFHISIMQQAKIIEAKEEQKVNRNENSMKLSCLVRGNPMPIVSWISNGHILSTTSKLNIEKIFKTVQDSTVFFNGYGNSITYLDPFKLKQSNEKFYSQLSKIDEKLVKLEIFFKNRDLKVAGNYQCYAYNALGRDSKVLEVKIQQKPFVNEKQSVQIEDSEVLESLPLFLTCLISGTPAPKISWYKNNYQLHENETVKLLDANRFLSIPETFSWDSGNYSCKGVNEVGEEKIDFRVTVFSPPKFIDISIVSHLPSNRFHNDKLKIDQKKGDKNEVKVMKGDDVSLECFAEGSPHPTTHWVKMNLYDKSKNELLDEDDNVLIIRSIKDSTYFMCYLNNTVGNIHKLFNVVVQYPPKFIEGSKTENHQSIKLHHGLNLDCKLDGNPEPNISWIFNESQISQDNKEFFFSNNNQIMRIVDAKKSNQGKFLCLAENDFGKVEKVFYVSVEVPIQWSAFGAWNDCSKTCGTGGLQYRTRICLLSNGIIATGEDYKCVGENVEMRKCNQLMCPVNGGWGKFSEWSKCPNCGNHPVMSKRVRKCDSPAPANGGLECSGEVIEEIQCNVGFCPLHGGWSEWTQYSACSKTCGDGLRVRKRFCNNPEPKHNGSSCNGENVEFEKCKIQPCFNHQLKKTFDADDEDDLEEMMSNESRDRYKEAAEFEIEDDRGITRNYQFANHREVEISPPNSFHQMPRIRVTLDTYKPISEETYKQHVNSRKFVETESTSSENLEIESTEIVPKPRKTCITGFTFNSGNKQCEDINECLTQKCLADERCFNTLGSFRCEKKFRRIKN